MKKISFLFLAFSTGALVACNSNNTGEHKTKIFPKPGTIVASAEMPVTDDPLNHFIFAIKVVADSNIRSGVYDVDVDYGPNFAEGQFTMPQGGEGLAPIIRKGDAPYTYIIGFKVPGDTTFHEYFEVASNRNTTKMQYLKGYTF